MNEEYRKDLLIPSPNLYCLLHDRPIIQERQVVGARNSASRLRKGWTNVPNNHLAGRGGGGGLDASFFYRTKRER